MCPIGSARIVGHFNFTGKSGNAERDHSYIGINRMVPIAVLRRDIDAANQDQSLDHRVSFDSPRME
jgi:hypothetical protein